MTKSNSGVTFVDYGHMSKRNKDFGAPAICFICGASHKAHGLARIEDKSGTIGVPLCESCLASDDRGNVLIRKYLNVPDLIVDEGGEATTEQVMAVAEKQDATEH